MSEVKTYKGFKPYGFQQEIIDNVLNEDNFYTTLVCGRQVGKTLLLINVLLYYSINRPKSTIMWVSPYYSMCVKVMTQILDAIEDSGIVVEANKSEKIISLVNGSRIWFRSSEKPETIRGLSVHYCFVDEAQDVSNDTVNKAILPTLTAVGKKMLIAGTPKKRNWFYTFFKRGLSNDNPNYKSFNAPSTVSPYVSTEFIEEQRQSLPANIFAQEFLAEFQDSDGLVFQGINQVCINDSWPKGSGTIYGGLDIGNKDDYTVLTLIDTTGRVIYIYRDRHTEYSKIVEQVVYICKKYKVQLFVETNSMGDVIFEMIKKQYKRVTPWVTSNKSKENIIRRLISDIQDQSIELPSVSLFEPLYQELTQFEYKVSPSGLIQYGAPSSMHDDCVISIALANYNRVNNVSRGKLVISSLR